MNNHSQSFRSRCRQCELLLAAEDQTDSCASCLDCADMVGHNIWRIVQRAAEKAPKGERVVFMLAGLAPAFMAAVMRTAPQAQSGLGGRSLKLVFNESYRSHFELLAPAEWTSKSPVHWRHSNAAEIIIFAPSDKEREAIGSSLGPVSRIDSAAIIAETDDWMRGFNESEQVREYFRAMIEGLRASQIFIDLDMWVNFLAELQSPLNNGQIPHDRIQNAAFRLRIPRFGIGKLPKFNPQKTLPLPREFRQAFVTARNDVAVYASLMNPRQEPLDLRNIEETITKFNHQDDPDDLQALDCIRTLIADEKEIRPGNWRPSQEEFCRLVNWERVGAPVFAGTQRRGSENLGQKTLEFINGNYHDEVSAADQELLSSMNSSPPKDPRKDELEFFARWQERLSHPHCISLFKNWQKRLFSSEVQAADLASAVFLGFEALLTSAGSALSELQQPCVVVRSAQHNKQMYWQTIEPRFAALFRLEYQAMKAVCGDSIILDLDAALRFQSREGDSNANERQVELEFYLMEAAEAAELKPSGALAENYPRAKVFWRPARNSKDDPVALALPEDLAALNKARVLQAGLFRNQSFAPLSSGQGAQSKPASLADSNSFSDVANGQLGQMFCGTTATTEDNLQLLLQRIDALQASHSLLTDEANLLRDAVTQFATLYARAIELLNEDLPQAFASDILHLQAEAYGALCRACRVAAQSEPARLQLRPLVISLAVIPSGNRAEPMAILAAWHPLRLAEWRARLHDVAVFVTQILNSSGAKANDLSIVFDERRASLGQWYAPEVVFNGQTSLICVEHSGGYSLMVPADCVARNQEALEATSSIAAQRFMEGVRQYLEIHPHEAYNLSAAIYDTESQTLPQELAALMAQQINSRPNLRCDLVLTHHDESQLRRIYASQNTRLGIAKLTDTARGFLSRLRVDVRDTSAASRGQQEYRDMDLVFLHDAVSQYARCDWDLEAGCASSFPQRFDLDRARSSKRRVAQSDAAGTGVYLSIASASQAIAEYQNLIYEMSKGAPLPQDGRHAVFIRSVQLDNPQVAQLLEKTHNLGEWVISFDKVLGRSLLEKCGIRIIRDMSVPGTEGRVIISAGKADRQLISNLRQETASICDVDAATAERIADTILQDVLQISGQKLLSAARYSNSAREMLGLSVLRQVLSATVSNSFATDDEPIWISLDDYRSWFGSGKGKVADLIAVSVADHGESSFDLILQVGEAKYIGDDNAAKEGRDAANQVRDTVARLRNILLDNPDPLSRAAWSARLAELLVNREGLSQRLPDPERRRLFLELLRRGEVNFWLSGEAVICVHNRNSGEPELLPIDGTEHMATRILPRAELRRLLMRGPHGQGAQMDDYLPSGWYISSGELSDSNPPETDNTLVIEVEAQPGKEEPGILANLPHSERPELPLPPQPNPPEVAETGFIPPPVLRVLQNMQASETGQIHDMASQAWAAETAQQTRKALLSFNMSATLENPSYRLTPNGALIAFKGHPTLTEQSIRKRIGELLTTHGIEVNDVRPGKGRIVLFVRRDKRARVPLASTWLQATWPGDRPGRLTSFLLGAREDEDRLLWLNIAGEHDDYTQHAPHTLIAGETGSGKGVLTQSLLLQMATFNSPAEAEIILIDPKGGVDFTWLPRVPHLKRPIATETAAARAVLQELVQIMDERYRLLAAQQTENVAAYNKKVPAAQRMPRIFLVHDELGSWMAQEKEYQEVVLSAVANLGMKARAAGIHLVLITQKADADAVPTKLRDNMGNRLSLKVANSTGSRMVLGTDGAEKLLGKGHLAAVLSGEVMPAGHDIFLAQVPFAENEDLHALASAAIGYWQNRAE